MSTAASPRLFEPARLIVVMGVSSSGKSVVGKAIARRLHAPFLDGDQFHPAANVEKMRRGIPLEDEDRWPWLDSLSKALHAAAAPKGLAVGACSALKRSYRDFMSKQAGEPILFVFLDGSRELIAQRISKRQHHFMPASLLDSQFATLERPTEDENVLALDVALPVETLASNVVKALNNVRTFKRWQ